LDSYLKAKALLCPVSNPNIHAELDKIAVHRACLGKGQDQGKGGFSEFPAGVLRTHACSYRVYRHRFP
jgi:hypothetical protein